MKCCSLGFKELPLNGAMLLYLSADGCFPTTKHPQDCKYCSIVHIQQRTENFDVIPLSVKKSNFSSPNHARIASIHSKFLFTHKKSIFV